MWAISEDGETGPTITEPVSVESSTDALYPLITLDNAAQLVEIAKMERYGFLSYLAFTPDGEMILTNGNHGPWQYDTISLGPIGLLKYRKMGRSIKVSPKPDSRLIATNISDGAVRLLDIETGEVKQTFEGHTDSIMMMVFSANGERLVTVSLDYSTRIWDVETGAELLNYIQS